MDQSCRTKTRENLYSIAANEQEIFTRWRICPLKIPSYRPLNVPSRTLTIGWNLEKPKNRFQERHSAVADRSPGWFESYQYPLSSLMLSKLRRTKWMKEMRESAQIRGSERLKERDKEWAPVVMLSRRRMWTWLIWIPTLEPAVSGGLQTNWTPVISNWVAAEGTPESDN